MMIMRNLRKRKAKRKARVSPVPQRKKLNRVRSRSLKGNRKRPSLKKKREAKLPQGNRTKLKKRRRSKMKGTSRSY
jgi:hypothetical protein